MSKKLVCKGILFGALIGGTLTLLDKDTRKGAAVLAVKSKDKFSFYKEHPAKCIADLRYEYEQLSSSILNGMDTTIQTLTKVQELIEQVEDEKER